MTPPPCSCVNNKSTLNLTFTSNYWMLNVYLSILMKILRPIVRVRLDGLRKISWWSKGGWYSPFIETRKLLTWLLDQVALHVRAEQLIQTPWNIPYSPWSSASSLLLSIFISTRNIPIPDGLLHSPAGIEYRTRIEIFQINKIVVPS